jgi:hypothetical protein
VQVTVLAGAAAGATAAAALRLLRAVPPGGSAAWDRTNHAGKTVSLLEGPAYVAGATAGTALFGAGLGPVVATAAAGSLGALDDLAGDAGSKGLKGHLGALRRGEVTTGVVKIVGLGVSGLLAAALLDRRRPAPERLNALDTLVGGAVVAGSANLLNLLDLRPGRALKATILLGTFLGARNGAGGARVAGAHAPGAAGAVPAAAAAGAALGLIGPDLAGETMLGDTGANSAGALLGTALIARGGRRSRLAGLAVVVGLTLASERVSFTGVIESTPGLRELDALGRR